MFETPRKLSRFFSRREWVRASLLFVVMLGGALLEMVGVAAIPAFVATLTNPDMVREHPLGSVILNWMGAETDAGITIVAGIGLAVVFVVKAVYLTAVAWIKNRFLFRWQVSLAGRLLRDYLTRPYAFHLRRNSAELLNNTNNDAMGVVTGVAFPLLTIGMEVLTLGAVFGLLLWVEPMTSLAAFGILGGVSFIFARVVRGRIILLGREQRGYREDMIRAVNEGLGGVKMTKVLGREDHFWARFQEASEGFARVGMVRGVLTELPRLVLEAVAVLGLLAVATYFLSVGGGSTETLVPVLTLLAVSVARMIPAFNRIVNALNTMRWGRASLEAVYADLIEGGESEATGETVPPLADRIRLEGVAFAYEGSHGSVLEDVSLDIRRGEAVGLVGPTGAGKTTLVDVILGLLSPTQGRVTIDGVDLRGREVGWRKQVGYIPQDIFLADVSVRENVAFGVPLAEIDDEAVWQALAKAQLADFVRGLPEGLATAVGERGVRVSGGQRQRIGIARALYDDPKVVVMDEATSALDNETEQVVMAAFERLKGGRTLILIAHRLTTVENCDRVVLLKRGRVFAEGPPEEILPLTGGTGVRAAPVGSSSGG